MDALWKRLATGGIVVFSCLFTGGCEGNDADRDSELGDAVEDVADEVEEEANEIEENLDEATDDDAG